MYAPTCMTHWVGSLQESILAVRVRQNLSVNSLFLSSLDRCIENIRECVEVSLMAVPTNLSNLIANRAMRYGINISHLLRCFANSSVNRLEMTNFGVGRSLPLDFYKELSNCTHLAHLDLYGFQLHLSQFCHLRFLTNLVSISLGCDKVRYTLTHELINVLTCCKLDTLQFRNFIADFKKLEEFPFLTTLSLSRCILSQSGDLERYPPLTCVTISDPIVQFGSIFIPNLSLFTSTLQAVRISFMPFDTNTLFKSQIFPFLISFCEYEDSSLDREGFLRAVHQSCPNLSKLVFLSQNDLINIGSERKQGDPPFEIISRNSTPPILMELILNHFHNPETGIAIADLKPTENTYYWGKGRLGNRATVSPHFLILANLLYLNPTNDTAFLLVDKLQIRRDLWDKEIICGEDYLVPLVHYYWYGSNSKQITTKLLLEAWCANCLDTERRKRMVAGIFRKPLV